MLYVPIKTVRSTNWNIKRSAQNNNIRNYVSLDDLKMNYKLAFKTYLNILK